MTSGFYFYLCVKVIDAYLSPQRLRLVKQAYLQGDVIYGSNCLRTVHRARSKSNVILLTAGGEGSMLSTSCSTAR